MAGPEAFEATSAASAEAQHAGVDDSRRWRAAPVLGALTAAAISVALAWWLGDDGGKPAAPPPPTQPAAIPAQARTYAPPQIDSEAVGQAYADARAAEATGGPAALTRASRACTDGLPAEPARLDYCLALDRYGAARRWTAGDAAQRWFAEADARDVAMAALFLPRGADAAARVAAVTAVVGALQAPPRTVRTAPAHAPAAPAKVAKAKAKALRAGPAASAEARACRFRSTPSQRVVCAHPALQLAERRVQAAYRQAVAHGANRRRLAREQADFGVALNAAAPNARKVAALYARRLEALRREARR